jgi:Ca-activated chloride channel family protein
MQNKIRQVEEALRRFIDLLEPADEIMVITFNDRVHVLQDFTSDRQQLAKVLDKLEPGGPTSLFDAAVEAIRRVAPGPAESKAVVLVTDGADTASATSFDTLLELARRSEVPVFSIGLDAAVELRDFFRQPVMPVPGGGAPRWPGGGGRGWPRGVGKRGGRPRSTGSSGAGTATFDARPLLDLAEETGGRAEIIKEFDRYAPGSPAPGSSRLKTAVESIAMTLRHRYLLGYEPPAGKRGWRTIRVDVERPATTARTRKGYYAGG